MKKQSGAKRRKLFLVLAIFCLLGIVVGVVENMLYEALFYSLLTVLFFVLWVKKPIAVKEEPSVTITTRPPLTPPSKPAKIDTRPKQVAVPTKSTTPSPQYKAEKFHVTGTEHYKDNIESLASENSIFDLSKKELIELGYEDERIYFYDFYIQKVELIEEPDNPYDSNAIKVVIDNTLVGYIKKGSCSHVKKLLHSGKIKKLEASIYGGKYKTLYSEFDYEKNDDVYHLETDKINYRVDLVIKTESE